MVSIHFYKREYSYNIIVEPLNNGHGGDKRFVHCLEVVPLLEVEMYGQLMAGGKQFVHCREVVLLSECPLSEVLLYTHFLIAIHLHDDHRLLMSKSHIYYHSVK